MPASTFWTAALLAVGYAQAAAVPTITAAPTSGARVDAAAEGSEATSRPWYVKQASQQVVDFCFIGGMFDSWANKHQKYSKAGGGGGSGGGGDAGGGDITVVNTMDTTYVSNYQATLYTTIPGDVITIYGSEEEPITSTLSDIVYSSVVGGGNMLQLNAKRDVPASATSSPPLEDSLSTTASAAATPTTTPAAVSRGFSNQVKHIENYAHAMAEAVIAPRQMTKALAEAYEGGSHEHIKAPHAMNLLNQVNEGMKALQTDPAYAKQRQNLLAQPTHVDFQKAVQKMNEKHGNQINRLLAEPSGHQVIAMAKEIGQRFMSEYAPEQA